MPICAEKICDMRTLLIHANNAPCGNMRNMRQSHIRIKLTCLTVLLQAVANYCNTVVYLKLTRYSTTYCQNNYLHEATRRSLKYSD